MNQQSEEDYIKGFNVGYLMTKYIPALAEKIVEVKGHRWMHGFEMGHIEAVFEKADQQLAKWESKQSPDMTIGEQSKEKDQDMDRE